MTSQSILNWRRADERLITGGQPTEEQLRAAAAEGLQAVINLAPTRPGKSLEHEAELVQSLGMAYEHIPVDWDAPREGDFEAFEVAMQRHASRQVLVHCALNFRATAFVSLYALKHAGWSPGQAEAFRATVWEGSDYPAWKTLIERITRSYASRPSPEV